MTRVSYAWTDDLVARMCDLLATGMSGAAVAEAIGVTRSAVRGKVHRMIAESDPRLPATRSKRGVRRTVDLVEIRDALADLMADGCPSVAQAGLRLGLSQSRVDQHWQAIRRTLGWQAQ